MSLFKKKKKEESVELTSEEQADLLKGFIKNYKNDLMSAKVHEFMFLLESIKPTNMGKAQALESLAIYQKRVKLCEQNILAVELYAREHSIAL